MKPGIEDLALAFSLLQAATFQACRKIQVIPGYNHVFKSKLSY